MLLATHFPVTVNGTFIETVSSVSRAGQCLPPAGSLDVKLDHGTFFSIRRSLRPRAMVAPERRTYVWPEAEMSTLNGVGTGGNGTISIGPRARI